MVSANANSAEARHMYPTSRSANDSTCSETWALLSCKTRRRPDTFCGYQDWAVANASLAVCREDIGGQDAQWGLFEDWIGRECLHVAWPSTSWRSVEAARAVISITTLRPPPWTDPGRIHLRYASDPMVATVLQHMVVLSDRHTTDEGDRDSRQEQKRLRTAGCLRGRRAGPANGHWSSRRASESTGSSGRKRAQLGWVCWPF